MYASHATLALNLRTAAAAAHVEEVRRAAREGDGSIALERTLRCRTHLGSVVKYLK